MEKDLDFATGNEITVRGVGLSRAAPDRGVVRCAVSHLAQDPGVAFAKVRGAVRSVQSYLAEAGVADHGASRSSLTREVRFTAGEQQFLGYRARIWIRVTIDDLDRIDELVQGLIDSGSNEIDSITFESTKLESLRSEARGYAVKDARRAALDYCKEADVALGVVVRMSDSAPLTSRPEEMARVGGLGVEAGSNTLEPGHRIVRETVTVTFQILPGLG